MSDQTAALALGVVGVDDRFTDRIWDLLEDWSRSGHRARVRTALAAYGGPLGQLRPSGALRALRAAATWQNFPSVAGSIALLLDHHPEAVLTALSQWDDPVGMSLFLFCAGLTDPSGAPVLIDRDAGELAPVWGRCIGKNAAVRGYGLGLLRDWCRCADTARALRPAVVALLVRIAGLDPVQRRRIRFNLNNWATDRAAPSATAYEALEEIPGER